MSFEIALGFGDGVADLRATLIGGADHLHAACFAGIQVAQLKIDLVSFGMLEPLGQHGVQLDLLGRSVAGVRHRQNESRAVADHDFLGRLSFQD